MSKKTVLPLIVLGVLCFSDIALRALFGLGDPVVVRTDSACGYILSPNQHKMRFGKRVDINQFGMRSDAVSQEKDLGRFRVLLVGDSILYGTTQVGQQQIFAALLANKLPSILHRPVETLNASASAWAIPNETDYIRSRGLFKSDLVVLVLNSGDLSQPRATLNDVGTDLPSIPYACAWCEVWARLVKPRIIHQPSSRKDAGTDVQFDLQRIASNLRYLDEFQSIVAAGHARMGIVFFAFRKNVADGAERSAPDQLVDWAQKRQIPLLDLTPFETRVPKRTLTLDGIHLSVLGNRIVATAIEKNWYRIDPKGT